MKFFTTEEYFDYALSSVLWAKRVSKFESSFRCFCLLCNCVDLIIICIVYSSTMFVR